MAASLHDLPGSIDRALHRLRRRALLALLARQRPEALLRSSRKRLVHCFRRAAARSSAYRQLLAEAGIAAPRSLSADDIIARAPILDKASTFGRFALPELIAGDVPPTRLAGILASSGYGGSGFAVGLTTRDRMDAAARAIDLGLEYAFSIDRTPTLVVNCLPMGVVFTSQTACIANVSVREDMALEIIRRGLPLFGQFVICADPLFLKRLLDHAADQRMDWSRVPAHLVVGGETFSEEFRSHVAAKLGIAIDGRDSRLIGSTMGTAELGLNLFFETRETVALRHSRALPAPDGLLPTCFCYDPLRTFVEIVDADRRGVGELVVTVLDPHATIPLVRYRTGDLGYRLGPDQLHDMTEDLRRAAERLPFPLIAMLGRRSDWVDSRWHVDHFKALAYRVPEIADELSGAFRIHRTGAGIEAEYQLRRGSGADPALIAAHLTALAQAEAGHTPSPRAICRRHAEFAYGMNLDYERKFVYLPRPA